MSGAAPRSGTPQNLPSRQIDVEPLPEALPAPMRHRYRSRVRAALEPTELAEAGEQSRAERAAQMRPPPAPVLAEADQRAAGGPQPVEPHAETRQGVLSRAAERMVLLFGGLQVAQADERIGEPDPDIAGQMIVADAGETDRFIALSRCARS